MAIIDDFTGASLDAAKWASGAGFDAANDRVDLNSGVLQSVTGVITSTEFDNLSAVLAIELTSVYKKIYVYFGEDAIYPIGPSVRAYISTGSGGSTCAVSIETAPGGYVGFTAVGSWTGLNLGVASSSVELEIRRDASYNYDLFINGASAGAPVVDSTSTGLATDARLSFSAGFAYVHSVNLGEQAGGGGSSISPSSGGGNYSGQTVSLTSSTPTNISIGSGSTNYVGELITLSLSTLLSPTAGGGVFSTISPSVDIDALLLPPSATINIAGQTLTVAVKGGIFPNNAVMALAGNEPALVQAVTLPVPITTATFTGGTVQTSFDRGIVPNAAVVQLNGQTVTVDAVFIIIDTGEYIVVPLIRDIVQPMIKDN